MLLQGIVIIHTETLIRISTSQNTILQQFLVKHEDTAKLFYKYSGAPLLPTYKVIQLI